MTSRPTSPRRSQRILCPGRETCGFAATGATNTGSLCGDATSPDAAARLLGDRRPFLMITDPPYGIELDSEWRDRAGLNTAPGQKRTKAMRQTAKTNPQIPS